MMHRPQTIVGYCMNIRAMIKKKFHHVIVVHHNRHH